MTVKLRYSATTITAHKTVSGKLHLSRYLDLPPQISGSK